MKVVSFQVPHVRKEAFRFQTDRGKHFYDQLHQHEETQIMLIEEGEGTLIAGDFVGRFRTGDLFVIGSGLPHVFRNDEPYFAAKSKRRVRAYSLYFHEKYLGEQVWQLEEMKSLRRFLQRSTRGMSLRGKSRQQAAQCIRQLEHANGVDKMIVFLSLLKTLSNAKDSSPLARTPARFDPDGSKRMNAVLRFTFQESHRKIYLTEVATLANLTVEAFCRYFKQHTQKTYTSFLNEVRVSNACRLLINKDLTIRDVCYQAGFTNLSHFNRMFLRVTGTRPSQYLPSSARAEF